LQGPTSAAVLRSAAEADIDGLKYFHVTRGSIAHRPVEISRHGLYRDLGYEIWMAKDDALTVWDAIVRAGQPTPFVRSACWPSTLRESRRVFC
jgi:aminomethyltransferase